jgi:hypothetical protein
MTKSIFAGLNYQNQPEEKLESMHEPHIPDQAEYADERQHNKPQRVSGYNWGDLE